MKALGKVKLAVGLVLSRFKSNRLDSILVLGFFLFMTLFLRNSFQVDLESGERPPLGEFVSGNAEKKGLGIKSFRPFVQGDTIANLDVVWVGKGAEARFKMDDGDIIELAENTLIQFKEPFKKKSGRTSKDRAKVLRGKAKLNAEWTSSLKRFIEIPSSDGAAAIDVRELPGQHPKQGSRLLFGQGREITVIFDWIKPVEGTLVVKQDSSGQTQYATITQDKSTAVLSGFSDTAAEYVWHLLDKNKNRVAGPFRFSIERFETKNSEKIFKSADKGQVEVFW